jgi:predicted nucleic acid-binding protein
MKQIYLDSNILIAYFAVDKAEEEKKQWVETALGEFAQLRDAQLCTSMWAVTEMVNVLVASKKMNPGEVAEKENQLANERRLRGLRISFVKVSPEKDYDFEEFFYHVRQCILEYHPGVGDAIHSVIMKNNRIETILTFDEDDFKKIPDLTVLHPKNVKI